MLIVYPKWNKLEYQSEFHLPPHGPVVFAAAVPRDVEIAFRDENVEPVDFSDRPDLVAMSVMLTCQMPRAFEIADEYRARGIKVIFGGIATMLHWEEAMAHADSVFVGEAEGHMERVIGDLKAGRLERVYQVRDALPDTATIGPARRDILNRGLYAYRGVRMVDLIHASRGCRFNCFPCCTPYLGGRRFRPRPVAEVVKELSGIDNNRLFFVDNSMAQDDGWEKELFRALIPLKKKWISHPIEDDDEILDLAARAGCWYVYQAVFDTSDFIRRRVKRLQERGIGVEGTILLGLDDHDEDYIKRLVDFLLEINLDLAEFTIMTPFPHTQIRERLLKEGRILHDDWRRYTCNEAVFRPAKMTPGKLEELFHYAWRTFYRDTSQEVRMANLFMKVMTKEKLDGTWKGDRPARRRALPSVRQGEPGSPNPRSAS
jgi:radical SAM superfamily enzyme YgiQ (UPF0313 family)